MRLGFPQTGYRLTLISIHALPRKNATGLTEAVTKEHKNFNPRTPSQECDFQLPAYAPFPARFQSTHSLTRMRHLVLHQKHFMEKYFNPRTPSQECDSNHYQKSLLIPSISYPYCTPPLYYNIFIRRLRNATALINSGFFLCQNKTTPHRFMVKLRCPVTINHIHLKGVVPI